MVFVREEKQTEVEYVEIFFANCEFVVHLMCC